MTSPGPADETFNPWSVVNLVFTHLADQGLHPVLGSAGDPGPPAAEGNRQVTRDIREHLATLRTAVLGE